MGGGWLPMVRSAFVDGPRPRQIARFENAVATASGARVNGSPLQRTGGERRRWRQRCGRDRRMRHARQRIRAGLTGREDTAVPCGGALKNLQRSPHAQSRQTPLISNIAGTFVNPQEEHRRSGTTGRGVFFDGDRAGRWRCMRGLGGSPDPPETACAKASQSSWCGRNRTVLR